MDDHWDLRSGPGCDSAGGKKFPSVSGLSLHVREWILLNFGKQKTVNWRNSEHFWLHNLQFWVSTSKTRCSPRTRMLTRMLMVQMSKHMDVQSRRKLFCNSLFEQSCAYFPCYHSAVWSGKCRVWSVECKVRSVECKVWSGEWGV